MSFVSYLIHVIKGLWDTWDLRGLMLLSLLLQTLLLLLAPLRKRTSKNFVIGTILCLYLLADWAANFAASVISSSQGNTKNNHKNDQPLAFWSSFLLVHLGGPDSITAFVLQDNDFWHRHALALGVQCVSAAYTFVRTLPQNQLWLPTLLVFVCGFIKYYEKTRSLYLASFDNLRDSMRRKPDAGPNYAKIMGYHYSMKEAGLPTHLKMIVKPSRAADRVDRKLSPREVMLYGHRFFLVFKRLIVDLKCSYSERRRSRDFFLHRTAEEAFRIIAVELNYMYDMLFTKANYVCNRKGLLLRLCSSTLVVTSFGLFYFEEKKFGGSDVAISYGLLAGAIAMDVSYWLTAFNNGDGGPILLPRESKPQGTLVVEGWSRSVSTYNLIDYCLDLPKPGTQKILDWFALSSYFESQWYVKPEEFSPKLMHHIFEEVKSKYKITKGFEEAAITARGGLAIRLSGVDNSLLHYVDGMDYDQSLLSWHIATDLCLSQDDSKEDNNDREISKLLSDYMMYLVVMQPEIMYGVTDMEQTRLRDTHAEVLVVAGIERKELSSIRAIQHALVDRCRFVLAQLKDPIRVVKYALVGCWICLFWLITVLLSPIMSFFLSLFIVVFLPLLPRARLEKKPLSYVLQLFSTDQNHEIKKSEIDERRKLFSSNILKFNTEMEPICIKGDRSKSVLFDGCRLAKELKKLGDQKWPIMSRVWVEMLTYAAVHCRPKPLAERLSKGGELICVVWLLMAHFGLVDQFEDDVKVILAKVVVDK